MAEGQTSQKAGLNSEAAQAPPPEKKAKARRQEITFALLTGGWLPYPQPNCPVNSVDIGTFLVEPACKVVCMIHRQEKDGK